jgi:hypothetical protein
MNDLKYLGYCFAASALGAAISVVLVGILVIFKSLT